MITCHHDQFLLLSLTFFIWKNKYYDFFASQELFPLYIFRLSSYWFLWFVPYNFINTIFPEDLFISIKMLLSTFVRKLTYFKLCIAALHQRQIGLKTYVPVRSVSVETITRIYVYMHRYILWDEFRSRQTLYNKLLLVINENIKYYCNLL